MQEAGAEGSRIQGTLGYTVRSCLQKTREERRGRKQGGRETKRDWVSSLNLRLD
jgi:hypothetical protein